MNRSRLSRKLEKQTIKNLFLSILGIIIILIALFKFGIPLLLNLSLFFTGTKTEDISTRNTSTFIAPPILNSEYDATNSAQVKIEGSGSPDQVIDLYINGNLIDKTETKDDGSFSFETLLLPGENVFVQALNIEQSLVYLLHLRLVPHIKPIVKKNRFRCQSFYMLVNFEVVVRSGLNFL